MLEFLPFRVQTKTTRDLHCSTFTDCEGLIVTTPLPKARIRFHDKVVGVPTREAFGTLNRIDALATPSMEAKLGVTIKASIGHTKSPEETLTL